MKVVEKHSAWVRWTHWLNAPLLGLMIWSGWLIYWANDVYPGFFPEWFYRWLRIDHRLAEGMAIHFAIGWLFAINGCIWLATLIFSKHGRDLLPGRQAFRDFLPTVLHDLHLRESAPPQGKYNAAQKIIYSGVLLLGMIAVASGLAIYKPVQLAWLKSLFGGYSWARLIHFTVMILFILFFILHVIQVIRAGWNNFRSMVAGFEVTRDADAE